jgi:hypothetical protein
MKAAVVHRAGGAAAAVAAAADDCVHWMHFAWVFEMPYTHSRGKRIENSMSGMDTSILVFSQVYQRWRLLAFPVIACFSFLVSPD